MTAKPWARYGSTRYLWKEEQVDKAVAYVMYDQGDKYERREQVVITTWPSDSLDILVSSDFQWLKESGNQSKDSPLSF